MASAIVGSLNEGQIPGGNGRTIQWGQAAFTTTGTTCTIPVHMRVVESVILTPSAAPATDETLYWADTLSKGKFTVVNGVVTIGRTGASPTSGLNFSFDIKGY
jgi:hypothetical protein